MSEEVIYRKIKYVGVDNWNRPVFKLVDEQSCYLSDTHNLFDSDTTVEQIKEFYKGKDLTEYLTYHGRTRNSEPSGEPLSENVELEII